MKRLYSTGDFKYYTKLKQILYDLELVDKNYMWLVSDIEAYPKKVEYQDMVEADNLLLSTSELVAMVEDEDFQWIWAVFSAISPQYSREEILKYDLPYVKDIKDKKYNPHEGIPRVQHPLAEFEIYAVDSSYIFIIADNEELVRCFKKSYPSYSEE